MTYLGETIPSEGYIESVYHLIHGENIKTPDWFKGAAQQIYLKAKDDSRTTLLFELKEEIESMKKLEFAGPDANKQVNWKIKGHNSALNAVLSILEKK